MNADTPTAMPAANESCAAEHHRFVRAARRRGQLLFLRRFRCSRLQAVGKRRRAHAEN